MTEDLEAKVVKMYRAGATVHKIITQLGISMGKLYRTLHKHKVPLRRPMSSEHGPRLYVQKKREA